ncbi:MAG: HAMP domain-containing protein [Clostridiales bacterium]|nr:HAMP domain-containing protein [Clostridiales bacterium]
MKKKLILSYVLIVFCLLGACVAIWNQGYSYIQKQNEEIFLTKAFLLADEIEEQQFESEEKLMNYALDKAKKFGFRITILDLQGTVLADSSRDAKLMDNHSNRAEVKEAIEKGSGSSMHDSVVMKEKYHYGAVRFKSGQIEGVLRLSTSLSTYQKIWDQVVQRIVLLMLLGFVGVLCLVLLFSRRIIKPVEQVTAMAEKISKGDYGARITVKEQDEIGRLAQAFNRMSESLQETMEYLNSRNLELENFEEMRKQFVSNVTHELKTPLTSIRGFVDTLKNGALEDKEYAEHFLDIIDIEAKRLGTLIQDILVLSEMESGKRPFEEKVPCDLKLIWNEVYELLRVHCKNGVELKSQFEEEAIEFYGNPYHLKEILLNLVDNALNYTEKGFVKVVFQKKEDMLLIGVQDTGIGIEKEHLPRLFERFYRVDKGRSRKQGGTGLGLSIVKHIVELYDGTIEVTSVPEKGSCFLVKLPL